MKITYASLDPLPVSKPSAKHRVENRTFQMTPGVERIPSGRLFATWVSGGTTECADNFVLLACSDDNGESWSEPVSVVDWPDSPVRTFDPALWRSPDGRLFWFWAQSSGGAVETEAYDGLGGVCCAILENPDQAPEEFRFSPSRRIANGVMLNKPTVLSDGLWLLPNSMWAGANYPVHELLGVRFGCYVTASGDSGAHFQTLARVDLDRIEGGQSCDEHMFVQLGDGRIKCFARVWFGVAESTSCDRGKSWSEPILSPSFQAPRARFHIRRLNSGRLLLVKNDIAALLAAGEIHPSRRERLSAWLSGDDGKTWQWQLLLDERLNAAYPDVCETPDGTLFILYDRDRRNGGFIHMARIREEDVMAGELVSAGSRLRMTVNHTRPVPEGSPQ